jgi:hypothetical protein
MVTANVYIDGFNFYYGALKNRPDLKWLNLESYARTLLLSGHRLNRVRYFTAPVKPLPTDPEQPVRQAAYLDAIETLPSVSIHKASFESTKSRCLSPNSRRGSFACSTPRRRVRT